MLSLEIFQNQTICNGWDPTCGRIVSKCAVCGGLRCSTFVGILVFANPKPYINVAAWFQRCIFLAKRFPTFLKWYNFQVFFIAELCDYNHIFFLEFFPFHLIRIQCWLKQFFATSKRTNYGKNNWDGKLLSAACCSFACKQVRIALTRRSWMTVRWLWRFDIMVSWSGSTRLVLPAKKKKKKK